MDRLYVFGANSYRELRASAWASSWLRATTDPRASGAVNAMRAFQDAFAYLGAPIAA